MDWFKTFCNASNGSILICGNQVAGDRCPLVDPKVLSAPAFITLNWMRSSTFTEGRISTEKQASRYTRVKTKQPREPDTIQLIGWTVAAAAEVEYTEGQAVPALNYLISIRCR